MDERPDLESDLGPERFIVAEPRAAEDLGPIGPSGDGNDISAQREQIEQTRSEMSGTIDAIQQKLSPEHFAQQAKDTVRDATIGKVEDALNTATDTVQQAANAAEDTAANVGSTVVETIKRNPIPAALAGLGLGWLIMEASKQNSQSRQQGRMSDGYDWRPYLGAYGREDRYGQYSGSPYEPTQGTYGSMGQQSGSPVDQAQQAAGQAVDQVQQAAGQVMDQAQQTAGQMASQVQQQAQQATSSFQQMLDERPLAVGAGALAVGLAVGLAIPETSKENQLMGQARETVVTKVEQAAQDATAKAEKAVEQAMGSSQQQETKTKGS